MSSYLERQQNAFNKDVLSASSKVSTKRTLAAQSQPTSVPSPAPSNTSNASKREDKELKRKREEQNVVFSQPQDSGYGVHSLTQVTYIIEYLKKKDEPKTFREILEYLSQVHAPEQQRRTLAGILRKHDRIQWIPDENSTKYAWDSGRFAHRPIINVRNRTQLLAYLQSRADAQGVQVKDLKDGWPNCEATIDELEAEHRILVTRTKKDNHARMVWANDPTLVHRVDTEFMEMWDKIKLPSTDEVVTKLLEAGQKPASEDPSKRVKAAPKPKEKKKRAPRAGAKVTNTHMAHLLKDYSHKKL
jgi:transcription initiation factor TFIIE subunit beta